MNYLIYKCLRIVYKAVAKILPLLNANGALLTAAQLLEVRLLIPQSEYEYAKAPTSTTTHQGHALVVLPLLYTAK